MVLHYVCFMPGAAVHLKRRASTHEEDAKRGPMTCKAYSFRCPRLDKGFDTCWYGCTRDWVMCHMFQDNSGCPEHLWEWCRKGYHVRENDRRDSNYDNWQGESSTREPNRKKRRRGNETEPSREAELESRLRRLGFYGSELPSSQELETAYNLYKKTVSDSAISDQDKKRKTKKIHSAWKNISMVIQGRNAVPSSTDSETAAIETGGAPE